MNSNHHSLHPITIWLISCALTALAHPAGAELTSRTSPELARVLREHEETDKNKDGILTFDEYDAFWRTQGDKKPANPLSMEVKGGDLLITEFEENNLGKMRQWGWKVTGQSFHHDLSHGTRVMKRRAGTFGGRFLLTSYSHRQPQTGQILIQLATLVEFARRQAKWFRRMERKGTKIHWLNAEEDNVERIISMTTTGTAWMCS